MMKTHTTLFAALLLITSVAARAEVSLIQVTGVFDAAQSEDSAGFGTFAPLLSQPFTFVFSYDPSVPDTDFSGNVGVYHHTVPPHQFELTSGAVTLSDSNYQMSVIGPPNPFSRYSVVSHGTNPIYTGLTLPAPFPEYVEFQWNIALVYQVSDTAVGFLDNGSGDDPLPASPFFLGELLSNASVSIDLDTYDPLDDNSAYNTEQALNATVTSISVILASLDGDLDGDGFVGIADLNIVLGNWNQNVAAGDPLLGDPSGDGFVGIEDLNTVLGNWNAGTPPVGSVVPEPATWSLLTIGGLILARRQK